MVDQITLLTVDDDESMRRGVRAYFEDFDFKVLEAADGETGLSVFREESPDVAVVDLRMPGMSGLDVIQVMALEAPEIPTVVLSGTGVISDAIDAIRRGAWDFVTKPIRDMAELHHVVSGVLERARLRLESRQYREHLEQEVARRTRELTEINDRLKAIVQSTRTVAVCSTIQEVSNRLLEEFASNMAAEGGSIYLVEDSKLVLKHTLDEGHTEEVIPLPAHEHSLIRKALETRQPLLIRDLNSETGVRGSGWPGYRDPSVLIFPFFDQRNEPIGVIALHNKTNPPFTEQDRELGIILSSYSCEAIRSARAIEALRVGEERLRLAWETSPDYFSITRLKDGLMVDVNNGFTELSGYSREEAISRSALDLNLWVTPSDRTSLVTRVAKYGKVRDFETQFRRKDGEIRTASISAGLMDFHGEPHFLEIVKDIEDSRKAREALARSEELFRRYFELGLVGMALLSPQASWVYVNDQICEMLGYSRAELLDTTWFSIAHPDDLESDRGKFNRMVTGEIEGYSIDKRLIRKDGETLDTSLHVSCIRRADGTVDHVIAHVDDITDRNSAARDLERYAEELETINRLGREIASSLSLDEVVSRGLQELRIGVESDCAMLFIVQGDGFDLRGSDAAWGEASNVQFPIHPIGECLCGLALEYRKPMFSANVDCDGRCTREECKSMGLKSVATIPLLSGDDVIGVVGLGSLSERDFSAQERFIGSLAHEIAMGLKNSLLFEDLKTHSEELEKRLADLRQANDERDRLHGQLLQAQKMEAIGTLAGGMAHDFNNLLQAILGYSDLLLMKKGPGDPDRKKLEVIQHAARDGADLVARILTFSRKSESRARPMDLNEEIRKAQKLLRRTVPLMIDIDLVLAEDLHVIDADPAQVEQILLNLAVNAQHAMPEGGKLVIETSNESRNDGYLKTHLGTQPGHFVLLTVSDTGVGIQPELLERIFEPFFTTKTEGEGTGLGLSMVHGIVTQHGGYITCHSEPGRGTSFKIYFPVSAGELISDMALTQEMPAFGTETILLVDDDDRVRDMARQMVEMAGYKVLPARSGEEALAVYSSHKGEISLILLDLIMPGMGGNRCLEELLRINPNVRVLLASGYSSDGLVHKQKGRGAKGFLAKPYDAKEILAAIRKVLDSGQL